MQSWYPQSFTREMGCTEAELLLWLPAAVGAHPLAVAEGRAHAALGAGEFRLQWTVLAPRRIALVTMPRLEARFDFVGVDEAVRQAFMRRFDLYMQRGGG